MDETPKWRDVLLLAPDARVVNAIMADYVETIRPALGTLPKECQAALAGDLDVQAAAVTLLRAELRLQGSNEALALLREAASIFASAAVRITLLGAKPTLPVA